MPHKEEDIAEAVPNNKLTLDNLAEGFQLFKTAFNLFYNIDPSMIQTLKLKQMVEKGLYHIETFLEKRKSKNGRQKLWWLWCVFCKVTPSMPSFPTSPSISFTSFASVTPEIARPASPLPLLSQPIKVKTKRIKTFMMIYFHLINSK